VAERVRVRDISNDEGNRLLRIVRRSSGSVVTWRRAQMVLLSAQAMEVSEIARVTFTSEDRVRDVLHNFNLDGFDSLYPRYAGGRPPTFTLAQRREVKKVALSRPVDHDLPFSTWSLAKLAEVLVAEGVVDDISHEGLRVLLHQEGVSFQRLRPGSSHTTPTSKPRRTASCTCTGSWMAPTTSSPATPRWSSAWMSSGRSTSSPIPAAIGQSKVVEAPSPGGGAGRPTPAHTACATCWPPMT